MKKFQCDNCGAALTIDEDELTAVCEYCGTTVNLLDEHPEYSEAIIDKQIEELSKPDEVSNVSKMTLWKLILTILTGMIIVSAAVAIFCEAVFYSDPYDKPAYTEAGSADFSWPATGLSAVLPEPPTGYGMVASDSDVHFSADVFEVSQQDSTLLQKAPTAVFMHIMLMVTVLISFTGKNTKN